MTVGFIGLGNMGQGMVDNLLQKGAGPTVFTRTRSKIEAMIDRGAKGATSVADLAQNVDVVLVCLPDVQTSRDLLLGDDGVIANARPGQVVVDHSTVDIATSTAGATARARTQRCSAIPDGAVRCMTRPDNLKTDRQETHRKTHEWQLTK